MSDSIKLPKIAIVVPCCNEEAVLPETSRRLSTVLNSLISSNKIHKESFIYFVDDGSKDKTWSIISKLHQEHSMVKGLKLACNFGHQNALLAGLMNVKNRVDCAISMDADLQHDENVLPQFIEKFAKGADIVYGVRTDRKTDSLAKKISALFFYNLMNLMGVKIVKNHPDYRLVSKKVLDTLSEFKETNLFLRGIFANIGFKTEIVNFNVQERFAGKTKYSNRKMLSLALDAITSFSVVPLRMVAFLGFLIFIVTLVMSLYVLYVALIRSNAVPGWASTVLPIYFIGGIQLLSIGLLGEYIGKIYKEVKARPRYISETELF